jgi:putative peptidoglycan lipid II flippase
MRDSSTSDPTATSNKHLSDSATPNATSEYEVPDQLSLNEDAAFISGEALEQVGVSTGSFPRPAQTRPDSGTGKHAFLVAAGILLSRIVGLVRQRVFAHYFGLSDAADAFNAAFRIPNFLQNVFGEGALSASFIPVYAKLLAHEDEKEATRVASAVLSILAMTTSVIVVLGVFTTPYLIDLIAPGFSGEKRELTIRLVQIFFPGAGLLVLSAWCLGVLNSHRRFFLSYTAPVIWNFAIIAALIGFGGRHQQNRLAELVAWGSVIGSGLQVVVQLPAVIRLLRGLRPVFDFVSVEVRHVIQNFFPVFFSRGVVQISAFVDAWLASWLGTGAVGALGYTQSIYTLPVSLFGMSVSAAELPTMSQALGSSEEVAGILRKRLNTGLQRIAFFIVPSAVAFLGLGDVIASVLYQTGRFTHEGAIFVWGILAGSSLGLLAATLGRLYSSTYYALRDTKTPLVFAVVHVVLATVLGYAAAILLPPRLGIDPKWGTVGLTASASFAAWVEFILLRRKLNQRIGSTGLPLNFSACLWVAALTSAIVGWGLKLLFVGLHPIPLAVIVLGVYGSCYFGITYMLRIAEARTVIRRILQMAGLPRKS